MPAPEKTSQEGPQSPDPARIRNHLANERTFLAWVRTGMAVVIFGFAIGRFAIAIQEFMRAEGHPQPAAGMSVGFGVLSIGTGIVLIFGGFNRYRRNRAQLESGTFEPAGYIVDLVAIITISLGLALAAYLIYIQWPEWAGSRLGAAAVASDSGRGSFMALSVVAKVRYISQAQ